MIANWFAYEESILHRMCELTGKIKPAKCRAVLLALQVPLCYSDLVDETLPHISPNQQS